MAQRTGLEIALGIVVGVALSFAMGLALTVAERRGWRIRQSVKGSASTAFAAMEDIFSPSASQARQVFQDQKRAKHRAPTPGDWLDDGPSLTGRFAGKLTVSVNGSALTRQTTPSVTSSPVATEPPIVRPRSGSMSVTGSVS